MNTRRGTHSICALHGFALRLLLHDVRMGESGRCSPSAPNTVNVAASLFVCDVGAVLSCCCLNSGRLQAIGPFCGNVSVEGLRIVPQRARR